MQKEWARSKAENGGNQTKHKLARILCSKLDRNMAAGVNLNHTIIHEK
jgi:hypothetical protein